MKVSDLEFETHSAGCGGTMSKVFFPNGYGASVITGEMFYTSDTSPYELAVVKGDKDDWSITYDTPITDDVCGYLTEDCVNELLSSIEALPNVAP